MKYLFCILLLFASCGVFKSVGINCGVSLADSGCKHEPHVCDEPHFKVQRAFGEIRTVWTDRNVLRVWFLDGTKFQKDLVLKYMTDWNGLGAIRIEQASSNKESDIRVSFKYSGSWSYVGTDNKFIGRSQPTMNYGWLTKGISEDDAKRVIRHEFGHALGLQHEHQHPKGGIQWDSTAVYDYYGQMGWTKFDVDNNLFKKFSIDQTNFTEYDGKSIMHYPISKNLTLNGYSVDWNTSLSTNDKKWVEKYYPYTCKIIRP